MPHSKIQAWNGTEYDPSRWVTLATKEPGVCTINLGDACQPGKVSSLSAVSCSTAYVRSALHHGTVQVTLEAGYFLLRGNSPVVQLEFRGKDDASTVRATFLVSDVESALAEEAKAVAVVG